MHKRSRYSNYAYSAKQEQRINKDFHFKYHQSHDSHEFFFHLMNSTRMTRLWCLIQNSSVFTYAFVMTVSSLPLIYSTHLDNSIKF